MLRSFLLALAVAVLCTCCQAAPLLTVPAGTAPTRPGAPVDAAGWAGAAGPGLFSALDGSPDPGRPQVYVTHSPSTLYVGARLPLGPAAQPRALVTTHDGSVWEDDAFEVFLAPAGRGGPYYQFIANARGTRWESRGRDGGWDCDWSAEAKADDGAWSVRFAIPFAALGVKTPAEGETWAANFAWDRQTPTPLISTWAPVQQGLHDPANFGTLVFRAQAPAISGGSLARGKGGWLAAIAYSERNDGPLQAELTLTRAEDGKAFPPVSATPEGTGERRRFCLQAAVPQQGDWDAPGHYRVLVEVRSAGQPVWIGETALTIKAPLAVEVEKYWLGGTLAVSADAAGCGLPPADLRLALKLVGADGKACLQDPAAPFPPELKLSRELAVKDLPAGTYGLQADLLQAGKSVYQSVTPLEKPARPAWLGSRAGLCDEVLPPWTPLQVSGSTVSPWGRSYGFAALPFPSSVVTAGEEVLAGPITLSGTVGGQALRWTGSDCRVTKARGNAVTLSSRARAGALDCTGTVTLEYDGMIRSDFRLAPQGVAQVEKLTLEVPLKPRYARYLYHWPGRWGSAYNAGALPREGYHGPFKPIFWLGDEARGFCWFSESDRNFLGDGTGNAIDLGREGDRVVLRVNLITSPQKLATPLDYTFGFEATPVKPMSPDVWDYRISHAGNYGLQRQPYAHSAGVVYPGSGNLDLREGTFECWVRPHFNPYPTVDPKDPGRGALNRNLFDLDTGGGAHVGFYWNIDDRGMRLYYRQGESYPLLIGTHPQWQAEQWHHVAFTWGAVTRLYLDGVKVAEGQFSGLPGKAGEMGSLQLGAAPSELDIDEVRVSSVARERFDLTAAPTADAPTLLLDHLDGDVARSRLTAPVRGTAGVVSDGVSCAGRFGQALGPGPAGKPTTQLDHLAQLGVRTLCFHEHWTDIQAYPATSHGKELHALVKACHEKGLQLLPYHGYEISDIAPEWDNYHDECLVYPRAGGYTRQPPQHAYIVCYNGPWQDFLADGLQREIAEYDTDGVYLDGTSEPWGCRNTHHGCGYVKPDGTIGTTYSIFATREMMRRIYTIVKQHNPRGQVNVHQSTCCTPPTLAWATSYWDGEQFGSIERGPFALEVLSLDAFRCEFMGHNWGVPAEFLCYNKPYTYHEAMAFTLLHDVLVRNNLEEESVLWRLMDDFGRQQATWLPYWKNRSYVRTSTSDLKVSLYNRPGKGLVAVVSNLGRTEVRGTVTFDLGRLQQPAGLQARDAMTTQALALRDGALEVKLGPLDYLVVRLK